MQNELLDNSGRENAAPWVRIALSGLLVAGLILMSSWLFRG